LSLETGKNFLKKPTDSKYRFILPACLWSTMAKHFYMVNTFDLNDNIMKDNSKGFAFWGVDEKGAITK